MSNNHGIKLFSSTLHLNFKVSSLQIATRTRNIQVSHHLSKPPLQETSSCETYWKTQRGLTALKKKKKITKKKKKDYISTSHDHRQRLNSLLN